MSSGLSDYDATADGGDLVSTDESDTGRSRVSLLVPHGNRKTPHGKLRQEGSAGEDEAETKTSSEGRDKKEPKASGDVSEPLFEPTEESEQQIHFGRAESGHETKRLLRSQTPSPRKRRSPACSQHSESTPPSTTDQSCSDFAEETHDGPRKSVSSGRNASKRKRVEEPPEKTFKPSRDNRDIKE